MKTESIDNFKEDGQSENEENPGRQVSDFTESTGEYQSNNQNGTNENESGNIEPGNSDS